MEKQQNQELTGSQQERSPALKRITSSELFAGDQQILIQHGAAKYLLRITRQGKLILTK